MINDYKFINLFRAAAAFWVLLAHCMIWGGWYGIPLPSPKLAVDLFMMISGYLMCANAFNRRYTEPLTTARNWFRFWLRRFFRIAPAYYLTLALAAVFSGPFLAGYHELQGLAPERWSPGGADDPTMVEFSFFNLALHVSFLFGLLPAYSFSTFLPDWSLSLEMQFYLIFPALLLAMERYGFLRVAIPAGVSVALLGFGISQAVQYPEPSLLAMKLNYFMAGMLLFRLLCAQTSGAKRIIYAVCALVLVALDLRYPLSFVLVACALLLSMITLGRLETSGRTPAWLSHLIDNRVVRFASDVSYSVYLFHGFFLSLSGLIISGQIDFLAMPAYLRTFFIFLFVSISTYASAYVVYRLVELPGIAAGRRVLRRFASSSNAQRGSNQAKEQDQSLEAA